jgi:hypothetical protein
LLADIYGGFINCLLISVRGQEDGICEWAQDDKKKKKEFLVWQKALEAWCVVRNSTCINVPTTKVIWLLCFYHKAIWFSHPILCGSSLLYFHLWEVYQIFSSSRMEIIKN